MIYQISQELQDELSTVAGFFVGWLDNGKYFLNDGDFAHYIKAGFDIPFYLEDTYGTTIKEEAIAIPTYKIHRYVSEDKDVRNIDFTSEPFQFFEKKSDVIKGETQVVTYYASASMNQNGQVTYSDPIVKESFTWLRDSMGFCYRTQSLIEWYYEDDTLGPDTKSTGRFLSTIEMIEEGKSRRHRIINGLQMPMLQFMILTMPMLPEDQTGDESTWETNRRTRLIITGRNFLAQHKSAFNNFGDDSNKQIITDISNAPETWLDNDISAFTGVQGLTMRLYVLDQLDVGSD